LRTAVRVLRSTGVSIDTTAKLLRIGRSNLRRYYRDELEFGRAQMIAALGSIIVRKALDGDVRAAIFYLSRFGGPAWKNTEVRLHGGLEGAPPIRIEAKARLIILPSEALASPIAADGDQDEAGGDGEHQQDAAQGDEAEELDGAHSPIRAFG
jgi:hypothetical protein